MSSTFKSFWQTFSEATDLSRIFSAYAWSNIVRYPEADRYQINHDTFLKIISSPKRPIGNILILQGGIRHMDSRSYYIRTATMFISRNVRVLLFEKLRPMVNLDFAHDVAHTLDYIRKHFDGPICVIGYSMGGVLLYSYLGKGYDQADLYIPTCCPLDLRRFDQIISSHAVFRFVQHRGLKRFGVTGRKELLEMAGTTIEKHNQTLEQYLPNLNKNVDKWKHKTIYVIASLDPITSKYKDELKMLNKSPLTYLVKGGWHCCLDTTLLTVILACNYIRQVHSGKRVKVEDIPYF